MESSSQSEVRKDPEWIQKPGLREQAASIWNLLIQRGWILVVSLIISVLGDVLASFYFQPKLFEAKGVLTIHPKPQQASSNLLEKEKKFLESESIQSRIRSQLEAYAQSFHLQVPAAIQIESQPDHQSLTLRTRSSSQEYSLQFTEELMREYLKQKNSSPSTPLNPQAVLLRDEIKKIQEEQTKVRSQLGEFEKEHSTDDLRLQAQNIPQYLKDLQNKLETVRNGIEALDQKRSRRPPNLNSGDPLNPQSNKAQRLLLAPLTVNIRPEGNPKDELRNQKDERDILTQLLPAQHPEIKKVDREIAQKESAILKSERLADQIDPFREPLFREELAIQKSLTDWKTRLNGVLQLLTRYEQWKSDSERLEDLYRTMSDQYQKVGGVPEPFAKIKQKATEAPSPIPPVRTLYFLVSLSAGLGLGCLLLIWMEKADDRLRTARDLYLKSKQNILGQIPVVPNRSQKSGPLLMINLPEGNPFPKAFREIRESITASANGHPLKTILVTSSIPSDGKSTNSVNLAISFAEKGKTVLIDADLRRMNIHQYFQMENGPGVLDILSGRSTQDQCTTATSIPNLDLLRAGSMPEHPGEMFLANKFKSLLDSLQGIYEYIIIDSAPVMVADDTLSLAPNTDGVIFVVRANQTPYRLVNRSLVFLKQRRAKILGLIFNSSRRLDKK